jgi:hypothetical protein
MAADRVVNALAYEQRDVAQATGEAQRGLLVTALSNPASQAVGAEEACRRQTVLSAE